MRSILLHVADRSALDGCLQAALSIARATKGHITCLHTTPFEAYVASDAFGGVFVMEKIMKTLDDQERELRIQIEEQLRNEDVSWDYLNSRTSLVHSIASHAALVDLIITGRTDSNAGSGRSAPGWLGDLVLKSRTPLLIPADEGAPFDPLGKAVVVWNGSYEAANAVRAALPLLKLAANVDVVRVQHGEEADKSLFPSTRLLEYLSRHDVHADLSIETTDGPDTTPALMACAGARGPSYMVMGAYGHSRIGEHIFGGVTRSLLTSSTIPLLIAH